jgi:hypothetical protein
MSSSDKATNKRSRTRRVAYGVGLTLTFWAMIAYLLLPVIWTRHEDRLGPGDRPMITRTADGIPGDPINLAFIGTEKQIVCAFHAAKWTAANAITLRSSIAIVGSVVLDRPDDAAPVSPLYYDGHVEDLAFEKPSGRSADTRHHIRLWKVKDANGGPPVWFASGTFDRGVGLSRYTLQVTHHIAPDVDAERDFVSQSLSGAGAVKEVRQITGVGPTVDGRNGGGDRYYTDGEVYELTLGDACAAPATTPPTMIAPPIVVQGKDALWRALKSWM